MEKMRPIQIIYAPGMFGKCVRWMFDRFTDGSNFAGIQSPWDEDNRVHGFVKSNSYNQKFKASHQLSAGEESYPDPSAYKVVLSFDKSDLLFAERCGFYRNSGCETEKKRYKHIIDRADASFVKESFGNVLSEKSVAKELLKIQFHDMKKHAWWNAMEKFMKDDKHHQFNSNSLWDHYSLKTELVKVSERYDLDLKIDEKVINNVVEKVKESYPVMTRKRAHHVLDAIRTNTNITCDGLDIVEQAYIETELEKIHDCVLFPYGSNWFKDTDQINEFLDTYPSYLKHMNPRLPWYNNIKNPFYLTGKIDESN